MPGSTLPERVAITSPSSGVKPIVVSTDAPSRIAHSEAPAPRWQLTMRSVRATNQRRRPPRDPSVGQAVKPVAPEPPALSPGRGQRVRDRGRRQRRVKRGVEAGDRRQVRAARPRRRRARRATSAGAAARDRSARSSSLDHAGVDRARPRGTARRRGRSGARPRRPSPSPRRRAPVAARRGRRETAARRARARRRSVSSASSSRSLTVLEPALTTSTRTMVTRYCGGGPGSARPVGAGSAPGHVQSRTSGRSSPNSRV